MLLRYAGRQCEEEYQLERTKKQGKNNGKEDEGEKQREDQGILQIVAPTEENNKEEETGKEYQKEKEKEKEKDDTQLIELCKRNPLFLSLINGGGNKGNIPGHSNFGEDYHSREFYAFPPLLAACKVCITSPLRTSSEYRIDYLLLIYILIQRGELSLIKTLVEYGADPTIQVASPFEGGF